MASPVARPLIVQWKPPAILIGFPLFSTLLSLLLLNQSIVSGSGISFFAFFWTVITVWYAVQIWLLRQTLKEAGQSWESIGFTSSRKRISQLIAGYLSVALLLFAFIELALANAPVDAEKMKALSDLSNLTPTTTAERAIYIAMGLVAGLAEELVYRGYAITSLMNYRLNKWVAAVLAAIPFVFQHGLKSIDQFGWFFGWGIVFGALFLFSKKLYANIIIHWLVILSALAGILQALK